MKSKSPASRSRTYFVASAVNTSTGAQEVVERMDAATARRLYGKNVEQALRQHWGHLAVKSSQGALFVKTADGRCYTASSFTVARVKMTVT